VPRKEVADLFGVSLSTIKRYVKRRRAGEDLEPRRSTGRKRRILATPEEKPALWAQLEEHDEATLDLAGTQDEKGERADRGPRQPSYVPALLLS
jgi:transposase